MSFGFEETVSPLSITVYLKLWNTVPLNCFELFVPSSNYILRGCLFTSCTKSHGSIYQILLIFSSPSIDMIVNLSAEGLYKQHIAHCDVFLRV